MHKLAQDIRHAIRSLGRSPTLTLAAVLTFALGVGPATVLLSAMGGVLLRPLPFNAPEELVWIWERTPQGRSSTTSAANFQDWRRESTLFSQMAAYDFLGFELGGVDRPSSVVGAAVSADLFPLLGVQPAVGRGLLHEEEQPGHDHVVVLSHRMWQRHFDGDPRILGRELILNDVPHTVVGVLPEGFWFFLDSLDVFVPLGWESTQLADRGSRGYDVIARPRPGVSLHQAQSEMDRIAGQLAGAHPATNAGWSVRLQQLQPHYLEYYRPALRLLLIAVAVVLLIACGNVAQLLLARGIRQRHEIAIRAALGAGRAALVRPALVEGVLLGLSGGAAGVLAAMWTRGALVAILPAELQLRLPGGVAGVGVDARLMIAVAAVMILCGVLAGVFPAWQASRSNPAEALKQAGAAGVRGRRARNSLVAWQVGLATASLVVSLLLLQSLLARQHADLGLQHSGVLHVGVSLSRVRYPAEAHRNALYSAALERVGALPGVDAALTSSLLPPPNALGTPFQIEGRPEVEPGELPTANLRGVSANYFDLAGIPLVEGRALTPSDGAAAPHVAVLSRTVAQRHWPRGGAVGRRIRLGTVHNDGPWLTIVGIAGDVRHPLDANPALLIYRPLAQAPTPFASLLVRGSAGPDAARPLVEQTLWSLDRNLVLWGVRPLEEMIGEALQHSRFTTILAALFAALGLALAMLGVYSASSHAVAQRTREVGIRMALGARPGDVLALIVRREMVPVAAGLLCGLAAAGALVRLPGVAAMLHDVSPYNATAYAAVGLLVSLASLAGFLQPARRATRVDPIQALRHQ